jgi:hypothetical protein
MSLSLDNWNGDRARRLDEIEEAHRRVGGAGRGRRYATRQLNRGYALLLAAEFQGFCRQLHIESAIQLRNAIASPDVGRIMQANLQRGRRLDRGNATPDNIGADFGNFGLNIWDSLSRHSDRASRFKKDLESLNTWRNAIVHDDFRSAQAFPRGLETPLGIAHVRRWRRACDKLAIILDAAMHDHLKRLTGQPPW